MPLIDELDVTVVSHYFSSEYLAVRSRGPHLKTIIDDFLEYHELFNKRREDFADALETFAAMGFAWERVWERTASVLLQIGALPDLDEVPALAVRRMYEEAFSRALNEVELERRPRELIKPGETTHRGIHCTADGALVHVRARQLEEWKCTWTSARRGLEGHPDWLMQLPGYCEAYGFDTAVIRAFYVNGAYEKGQMGKPVVRAWRLKWSEDEKAENWQLVETHKRLMIAEGRMEALPDGNDD